MLTCSSFNRFCIKTLSATIFSVREKLKVDSDSDISTTSLRASLMCPVSIVQVASAVLRVRTDLEKSLKITLVLENSWNSKKVQFVLEMSLNFEKISMIITKSP